VRLSVCDGCSSKSHVSGQFKYPAVQRYVHDLTAEMGEHIDTITGTLSMFIEVGALSSGLSKWRHPDFVRGVPTIRFAQSTVQPIFLTLSTVATFFSAVTATTLQFSYSQTGDILSDAVNASGSPHWYLASQQLLIVCWGFLGSKLCSKCFLDSKRYRLM